MEFKETDISEIQALLIEADRSEELTGFVYPDDSSRKRIAIKEEEAIVGFFTPRQDPDKVWRMGAIYITPDFRGKGLGSRAIQCFMADKDGRAFIEYSNFASKKAYEKAGFKKDKDVPENAGAWFINY